MGQLSAIVIIIMMVSIVRHNQRAHYMMTLGHVMLGMPGRRSRNVGMGGNAFHRDGRKRLNRQAQCQQHDDEEFAPT